MRGSEERSKDEPSDPGAVHGAMRGSGIIVTGMPRLKNVECGSDGDLSEAFRRAVGRDDDITDLSVRRLWISGFRFGLVRTPVVRLSLTGGFRRGG